MLQLQPDNIKTFLSENAYDVVKYIATFIPPVIKNETDLLSFVRRILSDTQEQGTFSKTFEHKSDNRNENLRAFAKFVLEEVGRVGLWETETESHARIDPDGTLTTYSTDIPQIEVSWQKDSDDKTFQCVIHYVEGDSEVIGTWSH